MREICTSGSEGGRAVSRSAYPTRIRRRTNGETPHTPAGVWFSFARFPVVFAPPRCSRGLRQVLRRSTTGYFSSTPPAKARAARSTHDALLPGSPWSALFGRQRVDLDDLLFSGSMKSLRGSASRADVE